MVGSVSGISESIVIKASIEQVWSAIRELDLKFWSLVESSKLVTTSNGSKSPLELGSTRKVQFKDGTWQVYRVVELSELEHKVSYEVIESSHPLKALSYTNTILAKRVTTTTSTAEEGEEGDECMMTFVEWKGDFSTDGGVEVAEDGKYKKRDGLRDLARYLEK